MLRFFSERHAVLLMLIVFSAAYLILDYGGNLPQNMSRLLSDSNRHKDLFPMNSDDVGGTILVIIGLIIAASGGIGGGGILVPILILFFHFTPKYAVPLSNFTIFGGSITNTILNVQKRHPDADRPLVDWSIITIMLPMTLAGAISGAYLGRLIPDIILILSLVALLGFTSMRTLEKGISQFKKESKTKRESTRSALSVAHEDGALQLDEADESTSLLPPPPSSSSNHTTLPSIEPNISVTAAETTSSTSALESQDDTPEHYKSMNTIDKERQQLLNDERKTSVKKVLTVSLMFVVVILLNLSKGGGSFNSPLGVECGSPGYWTVTAFTFVWIILISLYMRSELIKEWRRKALINYRYLQGDVEWNPKNTTIYPLYCIFAGFCAGMFGVGGGIVFGPMMLEMGIHPMVASATSAVMIFFTAITASTSFIAFGTLTFDYGIYLFVLGLLATAVGQLVVGYFVEKHKRFSIISLSIGLVIGLSAVLMGLQGILAIFNNDIQSTDSLSVCNK